MPSRRSPPALAFVIVVALAVAAVVPGLLAVSVTAADTSAEPPGNQSENPLSAGDRSEPSPRLVSLYPNPVADGDPGEFVAVEFSEPTNVTGWRIVDDGRQSADLPNRTVEGTVAFSLEPDEANRHTDYDVEPLRGWLDLADDGERIELRDVADEPVDTAEYDRAPEAELYERDDDRWRWRPLGATAFEPVTVHPDETTAFVLPDTPETVEETIREADERLLLAGYTLSSDRTVAALLDAHDRGVEVRVLVDGTPVGGIDEHQYAALNRLHDADITVTVLGGDHARYRFHHAKYAVVDDAILVTTENWKPAGTGGRSSRGWGTVLHDATAADALANVFRADSRWRDGISWGEYRSGVTPVEDDPADGSYPQRFDAETVPVERARIVTAPENAEDELVELIENAEQSIHVKQVRIDDIDTPTLQAVLDAARRGVHVEILLDSSWYVADENRDLARELERIAADDDLELSVTLVDPGSRFEKIHAKGLIVDERHVVVGSVNWNRVSLRENREVAVVLTGDAVATYYLRVFRADRGSEPWRLPAGIAIAVGVAWVGLGGELYRRLRWSGTTSPGGRRV